MNYYIIDNYLSTNLITRTICIEVYPYTCLLNSGLPVYTLALLFVTGEVINWAGVGACSILGLPFFRV